MLAFYVAPPLAVGTARSALRAPLAMALQYVSPDGLRSCVMAPRTELVHGRKAYDLAPHCSLCWTPYASHPDWGFWAVCDLETRDEEGRPTGYVHEMPKFAKLQEGKPTRLPIVATQASEPILGEYVRGLPWRFEPQVPFWKTCTTLVRVG